MKVLVTGSHFTPAQAVITELQQFSDIDIVYIGRKTTKEGDPSLSVESQVLPTLGIRFIPIVTGRLQRKLTRHTLPSLLKIPIGLVQSFYYLLKEQPDVVVSFGGYVGVPVVICAWLLSIPVIIHEQTLISGLANTISSWFATKVAVSFESSYSFSKDKIVVTGNPVRKELLHPARKASAPFQKLIDHAQQQHKPLLLVTGGNQGAHLINEAVFNALPKLVKKFTIIHQTGESKFADFEKAQKLQAQLKQEMNYYPTKWINAADMGVVIRQADLSVSRAGMNTLLELALVGLPVLCVPLPFVQKDEQRKNAEYFAKAGLAKVLLQEDLSGHSLETCLVKMLDNLPDLRREASGAKELVVTNGEKRLVQEILILAEA